ncbi:MAG TPA: PLP-dependent aminotransferase family protein [Nocardioides sp.]|uniref:MocR-like pyridoxine biosynthesis transcription factor PdxR n=1 Tax=Nocardioides sp. TaxID=35761 RepID=UPI002E3562AA|nr:PLP-dependent aminotransferase family protein [Nocardioides sp.]HEX3929545.1 PLP-dependent aminotransferase family protein [Nocardioides sp.]
MGARAPRLIAEENGVDLQVTLAGPGDRVARIYRELRAAVLDGRLEPGDRVPATRDLARQLGVARGTVTAAYDRLSAEGFLEARTGSGTYVATVSLYDATGDAMGRSTDASGDGRRARPGAVHPLPLWEATAPRPSRRDRPLHDLSLGQPEPALFPLEVWRRLVGAQLRRSRLEESAYSGRGSPRLQREIARFLGLARGVVASGDDVIVTAGAQQAVDLMARVVLAPRAVVAVEDPGYFAVHRLLETHRVALRGVPVDDEGLVVEAIPPETRLVYVTPSHQFPTGVAMSLGRRVALLRWAVEHDALILEDDYDSEFRFGEQPVEPLQSLDRVGRVAYVGTFSKSLLPALRVGYVVPPRSLAAAVREAKRVTTWEGDLTTQGALAEFLAEGHHAAHVRRATRVYRERRDRVLAGLAGCADLLDVVPSVAGLHVCARFRDESVDDREAAARAAARGVRVEALSDHYRRLPPRPGLAIGFGGIGADAVPDAMRRLEAALRGAPGSGTD